MLNLGKLSKEIHQISKDKGWWNDYNESCLHKESILAAKLALIHSEVSEALEALRDNQCCMVTINDKPEGLVVELADVVIRVLDLCEAMNLDIEEALVQKVKYNKTRPYKHGGKKV